MTDAILPVRYSAAKQALAECDELDECRDWSDKAAALASYAKQADDDDLYKTAVRIQSRAIRRAGELLKEFQADTSQNAKKRGDGDATPFSQREAAEAAGMSKRQEVTARRLAEMPEAEFEQAVESDAPPTITKLAGFSSPSFQQATQLIGTVRRFARFCSENQPEHVAGGIMPDERLEIIAEGERLLEWLGSFTETVRSGS